MTLSERVPALLRRGNAAFGRLTGFEAARAPRYTRQNELGRFIKVLGVDHVLDVGAYKGEFARSIRYALGFDGPITSFEPSPRAFSALTEMAAGDPRWNVVNVALGATDGQARLNEFGSNESLNSIRSPIPEHIGTLPTTGTTSVPLRRLDSMWDELGLGERVLLKTDTQGFDLEVIRGASEHLAGIPAVMMEVAVRPLYEGVPLLVEVLAEMGNLGFELTGAFHVDRHGEGDLRVVEFDCTFLNCRGR